MHGKTTVDEAIALAATGLPVTRVAASAVRVLESLRPHPRDLLYGLPATGAALDEGSAHDLVSRKAVARLDEFVGPKA